MASDREAAVSLSTEKGPANARTTVLDRYFQLGVRGSTIGRELRGGLATFFTMAYIIVLNPIILAGGTDKFGHHLDFAQLSAATALIAAIMTIIMGVGGNLPLAIAAGLGLDGVVAFQIAPTMSWPDAMGLVVIEGLGICLLVVTGLRRVIMDAIPLPLKQAISVGIGLFIAFIGLVDAGFVHTPNPAAPPGSLGANGNSTRPPRRGAGEPRRQRQRHARRLASGRLLLRAVVDHHAAGAPSARRHPDLDRRLHD